MSKKVRGKSTTKSILIIGVLFALFSIGNVKYNEFHIELDGGAATATIGIWIMVILGIIKNFFSNIQHPTTEELIEKRNSYQYRKKYIQHNPGLFRRYYICTQCLSLVHKKNMNVDHIIPINRWYGANKLFNCVATCSTCNKRKSDKITLKYVLFGIVGKLSEEILIFIMNILKFIF